MAATLPVIAESSIKPTKTIVFKKVGDLEIPLDIYLPSTNAENLPVLLWYHGGGLLQGNRNQLASYMRRGVEKYHYACISADYRFAPQATLPEILSDVLDCIAFIRTQLPTHLPTPTTINPTRLAVTGASAGGYLALLAGLYAEPKPSAILPIYPITDPLGTFFTTPQPPPMQRHLATHADLAEHLDPRSPQIANCPALPHPRMHMYVRMMADASLSRLYGIHATVPGTKSGSAGDADRWRVSRMVWERRVPHMYMLHGDADTCVGVEQADEVVGAVVGVGGVNVVYERVRGEDHFLDCGAEYENEAFMRFFLEHV